MMKSLPLLAFCTTAILLAALPEGAAAQAGFGPLSRYIGVDRHALRPDRFAARSPYRWFRERAPTSLPMYIAANAGPRRPYEALHVLPEALRPEALSTRRVFLYTSVGAAIPVVALAGLYYAAGHDDDGSAVGVSDATAALVLSSSIVTVAAGAVLAGGSRRRAVIGSVAGFFGSMVGASAIGTSVHPSLFVTGIVLSHSGLTTLIVTF